MHTSSEKSRCRNAFSMSICLSDQPDEIAIDKIKHTVVDLITGL
jgi:hypothetical protein